MCCLKLPDTFFGHIANSRRVFDGPRSIQIPDSIPQRIPQNTQKGFLPPIAIKMLTRSGGAALPRRRSFEILLKTMESFYPSRGIPQPYIQISQQALGQTRDRRGS